MYARAMALSNRTAKTAAHSSSGGIVTVLKGANRSLLMIKATWIEPECVTILRYEQAP